MRILLIPSISSLHFLQRILLFSLYLFLDMMMSFCKKSVHSFLGFIPPADSFTASRPPWKSHHSNPLPSDGLPNGLGLISAVSEDFIMHKSPNVLASASVKSFPPPKKDPGGIGFIDDIGGGVDGLMSCTESLGFESSDERLINDVNQMKDTVGVEKYGAGFDCGGDRRIKERRRRVVVQKFPPPLSSLNQHGQPKFYLRSVRKEGRLELMEVRIERPEILRASREDGRLRLRLIRYEHDKEAAEEELTAEEHEQEEEADAGEEELTADHEDEQDAEVGGGEVEEVGKFVKEEGKRVNNSVTGEGFRRCIEVVNRHHLRRHHHHHHLDAWRQHCVTSS